MKSSNLFLRFILPVFTCFLSLAAVIIGAVALAKAYEEPEIENVYQIGLYEIFEYEATEIFVDAEWTPYKRGTFTDKELLTEVQNSLRETLKNKFFIRAKKPKTYSSSGSGEFPYLRLTINGNKYGFSVVGGSKLEIFANDKTYYYFTECVLEIEEIINETIDFLFPEQDGGEVTE